MTRLELTELVKDAQNGDKTALEKIYNFTHDKVYGKILSIVNNADEAEDIVQDCYLSVISNIGKLKDPNSFEKWFNTIIKNKIKDFQKKSTYILADVDDRDFLYNIEENSSDYIPHESLERTDNNETIKKLINELSEKNRQSIEMHYLENKSIAEIADELEIPENTVKTRLYNGRKELEKKAKIKSKKFLLTIFVLLLLLATMLVSVFGSGEMFSKIIYKFTETFSEFRIDSEYRDTAVSTAYISQLYTLTYLPEGFVMVENEKLGDDDGLFHYHEKYAGSIEYDYIIFLQYPLDTRGIFDTSDAETKIIYINGNEITFNKKDILQMFIWEKDGTIFNLQRQFSSSSIPDEKEMMKVIEGIVPLN